MKIETCAQKWVLYFDNAFERTKERTIAMTNHNPVAHDFLMKKE